MAKRWEKERAAWVLSRAGRNAAARRRGEKLMAAARKVDRDATGAGDSGFNDVTTHNVFRRSVMREEGASNIMGWLLWTLTWMFWIGVLAGPGLLLAKACYGLWALLIPKVGRLKAGPFLGAAVLTAVGSGLVWFNWPPMTWETALLSGYIQAQILIAMIRGAWLTRAYGWAAVKARAKASATKVEAIKIVVPVDEVEVADGNTLANTEASEPDASRQIAVVIDYDEDETDTASNEGILR